MPDLIEKRKQVSITLYVISNAAEKKTIYSGFFYHYYVLFIIRFKL